MGGIDPAYLLNSGALMACFRGVFLALAMLATPLATFACGVWEQLPHEALHLLTVCDEPPVQRQLGNVCVRHEWLCGKTTFRDWFDGWMAQRDEPIVMEQRMGQLIFSGVYQDTAWAMFWAPVNENRNGFVVLLSRLKTAATMEKH